MRRELLASKKKENGLSLDPRTKLALLITIALFVLSGGGGAASKQFAPILAAVPLILLLTEKSWKGSVIYFVLYGGSYILQLWALPHLSGLPNFLVVAICGFFMRFVPGIMMGYITVRTTTVSEFVASMKKLHLPEQIIIPMSVIFRFFPTVVEEYNAIGDAMKMRGIRLLCPQEPPSFHLLRIPISVGILSVIVLSFLYSYYSYYYYYSYPQTVPDTLQKSTASYEKTESTM